MSIGARSLISVVLALLTGILLLSCGEGADQPGQSPDSTSITTVSAFVSADSAAASVQDCSYSFRLFGTGTLEDEPWVVGEVTGRVQEGADAPLLRISLGYDSIPADGITPDASLLLVAGADSVFAYNLVDSIMEKGSLEEGGSDLLRPSAYAIMNEFFIEGPFTDEMNSDSVVFQGNASVGDEECLEWLVTYAGGSSAKWSISIEDDLPRRVERFMADRDGNPLSIVLEIEDLEVNSGVPDSLFTLDLPATEVITYSAFLKVGTLAPDWILQSRDGAEVSLQDLRGRIVILDFWATWCGPCAAVMPAIQAVHEQYSEEEVVVFGVNVWETGDPLAFMDDNGYTYGLLLSGDQVAEDYMVSGIPTMYILDREGRVAFVEVGANPDIQELLVASIEGLLQQ